MTSTDDEARTLQEVADHYAQLRALGGVLESRRRIRKYNDAHDAKGRFAKKMGALKATYPEVARNYPRSSGTEMGSIESHTGDVAREWETQISTETLKGISERFGSDVDRLMETAIPLHDIGKPDAIEAGNKHKQHEHTVPIMQDVLWKEGFSEKDIVLATELLNHDLIGPLFRGRGKDTEVAQKLTEKARRVGMNVQDFATLQLAFYQADAAAYPYITHYMKQEPSGRWTFEHSPTIAAIVALTKPAKKRAWEEVFKYNKHHDAKGRFSEGDGEGSGGAPHVKLYRGDTAEVNHALSYSDPNALFGAGIYLTDSKRIAGDYKSKGKTTGEVFRYVGGSKTTKQDAIDAYVRTLAKSIDVHGKDLPYEEPLLGYVYEKGSNPSPEFKAKADADTKRIAFAQKKWETLKGTLEVRKLADHTIVFQKKGQTGHLSEYHIPKAWISKTLNAEEPISQEVAAALHSVIRKSNPGLAREIYDKATREDEEGNLPSFREVYREAASDSMVMSGLETEEGQLELRRRLKELGFKGIQYAGGMTMGGARHTAYVFWDEQGLKKVKKASEFDAIFKYNKAHDEKGRFATASGATETARQKRVEAAIPPIEGGFGPARAEWERLIKKSMAATDAYVDAKEHHYTVIARMRQKYGPDEGNWADDTEYQVSLAQRATAQRVDIEADQAIVRQAPHMQKEVVRNLVTDAAEKMGLDASIIDVVHKDPPEFDVGDKHYTEAGHYDPNTQRVEINAKAADYANAPAVKGLTAHELTHAVYHQLRRARIAEYQQIQSLTVAERKRLFEEPEPNLRGAPKPEAMEELRQRFPATALWGEYRGEGALATAESKALGERMDTEDGHSSYAKSYWTPEYLNSPRLLTRQNAENETLAEVTRWWTYPKSWQDDTVPDPQSPWVVLAKKMHEWAAEREDRRKHPVLKFAQVFKFNQAHDAKGRFTTSAEGKQLQGDEDDARTFFHGTAEAYLADILKQGLLVGHAGEVWPTFSHRDSVYMTTDEEDAFRWAGQAGEHASMTYDGTHIPGGGLPLNVPSVVVLKILVPEEYASRVKTDANFSAEEPQRQFEGNIPPSWIVGARVGTLISVESSEGFNKSETDFEWKDVPLPKKAEDGQIVYVVVVLQSIASPPE